MFVFLNTFNFKSGRLIIHITILPNYINYILINEHLPKLTNLKL